MVYRKLGFLISAFSLSLVFMLAALGAARSNFLLIACTILFNIILSTGVLLKVFTTSRIVAEIKEGQLDLFVLLNKAIVNASLSVVYVVGIGIVWVASRIVGKRFMASGREKSMWTSTKDRKKDFTEQF